MPGGGIVRRWRHLPLRRPAPGGLAAAREPPRCHIVAVRTATLSHRGGCGAVTGAAAARREGPPGPAEREGCARGRRRPALHSPAGSSLQKSQTHAAFMLLVDVLRTYASPASQTPPMRPGDVPASCPAVTSTVP